MNAEDPTVEAEVEWTDNLATAEFVNEYNKGSVKVTKVVSGTALPEGFVITNDYNEDKFTVANAKGSGTADDPYYWTIEEVLIILSGYSYRIYASNIVIDILLLVIRENTTCYHQLYISAL